MHPIGFMVLSKMNVYSVLILNGRQQQGRSFPHGAHRMNGRKDSRNNIRGELRVSIKVTNKENTG